MVLPVPVVVNPNFNGNGNPGGNSSKDNGKGSSADVKKASELPVVKPGTKEWDDAVRSLSGLDKGKANIRTGSAEDAKRLLVESRGNMDRRKQYTQEKYIKGYEVHNDKNNRELEVGNDLQHLKWKDGKSGGHIYYDKPN